MHKVKEAIDDCTKAIELDEGYVKAYQRRAKCYMDSEMYEEAVRDYEKVCQLDSNRGTYTHLTINWLLVTLLRYWHSSISVQPVTVGMCREQAGVTRGEVGVEEEQEEGLL